MEWFRKDRASENIGKKYVQLYGIVTKLLQGEAVLIRSLGKLEFEDANGTINGPALGYLYGFADAAMHTAALELDNENGKMLMTHLFDLFAEGKGERYFGYMVQNISRDEIFSAAKDGGETYMRWVKSEGKTTPWGLGKYLGMRRSAE